LRILFFSSMKGSAWGGSEELWAAAAMHAIRDGHDVRACVFEWPGPLHPKLAAIAGAGTYDDATRGVASVGGSAGSGGGRGGGGVIRRPLKRTRVLDLIRSPGWLREIDRFAPQVVCLSQGGAYEAAGRKSVHPFVRRVLATGIPLVNVVQYNDDDDDLRPAARSLAIAINQHAAANVFVARRNIVQAERALRASVPRARVLCNPVNLPDTSPLAWPDSQSPARFAVVARLQAATKGQDLLLDALAGSTWRHRDWQLTLFGEGPDADAFRAQAASSGIAERVIFAGHASSVRDIWCSRHLLVLPSRAEGTPLAMVEAMLLGRPCVVTDVGGCADWVRDGKEGWIAPRASTGDIDEALNRAWEARPSWPEVGRSARSRAIELPDPQPGRTLLDLLVQTARR